MNKRGQMTIFVIIAIVIVVAGILIFQFVPQLKGMVTSVKEPEVYLQDCIEEDLMNNLDLIMSQGGVYVPSGSVTYGDREVEYLCYIEGYLEFCIVQKPFINKLVAEELKNSITNKTASCF